MAPSPAAGRTGQAPRTPTKQAPKLGRKPQTPQASDVKKPEADSPNLPPRPSQEDVKDTADDAKQKADDGREEASKVEMQDPSEAATSTAGGDDDEETPGKVSQVGEQGKGELEEQEPKPVDDSEDTTAGAQQTPEDDDDDDNHTEKAGDTADDAEDTAGEEAEGAQEEAGEAARDTEDTAGEASEQGQRTGGASLDRAKGLAGRASSLAGQASQDGQRAAGDAPGDAQQVAEDTTGDVQDTAEETAEGAQDTAQDTTEGAQDTAEGAQDTAEGAAEDAQATAGEAAEGAEEAAGDITEDAQATAGDATEGAEGTTGDVAEGAEEAAGDVAEGVQETAEDAEETAEDAEETAEDAQKTAEGATDEAQATTGDVAEGAQDQAADVAEGAEDTVDGAKETAEGAADQAEGAADEAKEGAEDATGQELPTPDLSILKGLEVQEDGSVLDKDGKPIGRLAEGDAEDLVGYTVGDNGEILDDDGDLVGVVELLPEKVEEMAEKQPEIPDVDILEGKTVDQTGQVFNEEGDAIGQLVEGDVADAKDKKINEKGEVLDDEGNVVGRVEIHPDVVEQAQQAADAVDGVKEGAEEAKEPVEGIEDELPGVEALEGKELNEQGEVVDEEGNVLAKIADDADVDPEKLKEKGMHINDKGDVVDAEGNILGKMELAEGAAEKLKEEAGILDPRILDGLKVNRKGKILNEDGDPIGELVEGDPKECAGKTVNDHGEVLDNKGKVIGKVKVVPGEAADEAMQALREKLAEEAPEEAEEPQPEETVPGLEILEGLKVNKKGKVLNEDGEEIGELVDGDPQACAGKKVNDKGEVLDNDGNVIGRVRVLPQEPEEQPAEEEAPEEEAGPELPPLSILEGLKVNKAGKIVNNDGVIVGELIEGDAKKLSKSGITADDQGQFWDSKGHVIGRARTVPIEEPDEEAPFAGLEGLMVRNDGKVIDENENVVGQVVEGDPKKLVGRSVDEDGDILDKKGNVVGHAERYEEPEPEPEPEAEPIDLSEMAGKVLNKQGYVIGDEGVPIGRLVEGNAKELAGKKVDENGQIWNDSGKVIGRVELIPKDQREAKPEGPFAGLHGLRVVVDGKVADEDENIVGQIVEGNPKRLIGLEVDEDGDILDKYGNVKGHAEPLEEEAEEAPDLSVLEGKTLNKQGYLVGDDKVPVGRLAEGNLQELVGRKSDGEGLIHDDVGRVVGRCELLKPGEVPARPEGPFAGLEGLKVVKDGFVEDADGNIVGKVTDGDPKKLVGRPVDEDGDIVDRLGNAIGHAEPYEEEEAPEIDYSVLNGCTVNKAGNVVNDAGRIVGRVTEGDVSSMIGKRVDEKGQIWDGAGHVIGHAEPVQGYDTKPEGPFAGFDDITVTKDGMVVTPDGSIVGRIIEGDVKKLVGHKVDEDGDITDKNGNSIGKAERWEPEEKEKRINPMCGLRVNRDGEVRDLDGNLVGRLTAGDLGHCVGLEIDENGYVVDNDGNKVGEVTLLENIVEEEPEGPTEEELQRQQDAEIADKMANICQQTLERIQPVCKQITEYMEKADRTPREELDEEELVNNVKPLIEEGGRILEECNGALRALDPDGRIAAQAKGRAGTRDATPEEYRLADTLKELTTTVVTTIDNAKKKLADMPHAKKKLNPLWGLLTEPLFQILAAVGLLLTGVLGLVGRLLGGLGLGGLVNGLLGGLGLGKLLNGLGLGSIGELLGGGDKKKGGGNPVAGLPVIGGILGGGK